VGWVGGLDRANELPKFDGQGVKHMVRFVDQRSLPDRGGETDMLVLLMLLPSDLSPLAIFIFPLVKLLLVSTPVPPQVEVNIEIQSSDTFFSPHQETHCLRGAEKQKWQG
jgi:hypothetical protein